MADIGAQLQAARSLHRSGQLQRAQQIFEEILRAVPAHYESLHSLGVIAGRTRQYARAVEYLTRAIASEPRSAAAYNDRGIALKGLRQWDAALADYDRALSVDPLHADAHANRGNVYWELRQWQPALAAYDRALAIHGAHAEALHNRGLVLNELNRWDEALQSIDRAVAVRPSYANAWCSRGVVQQQLQQVDAAIASFDRAIALQPEFAVAHCNLAYARLLNGDFAGGWPELEWRWRVPLHAEARSFRQPLWRGTEPLHGKSILLYGEQGLGDTLQFCRYVKSVAALGARVTLEVPPALAGLLAGIDGVAAIATRVDPLADQDFRCPLMSLPLAFGTGLDTIPADVPYLAADAAKVTAWRERLGAPRRPRVGLVWSGGFRPKQPETWAVNDRRNVALAALRTLGDVNAEFYSLQKGQPAEAELSDLQANGWDGPALQDLTGILHDYSDTAALVQNLDLVISVDTSVVHLAGALGKPVWVLNRFDSCWRWLRDRSDSPWYPSLRLYRQDRPLRWDGAIARVRSDLQRFAAEWHQRR